MPKKILLKSFANVFGPVRDHLALTCALIFFGLNVAISSATDRQLYLGSPSELVVFDFLTAMKGRYSVESSKSLWRFVNASKEEKQKKGFEGEVGLRTVLITQVYKIEQSPGQDIVAAIVSTEECECEVFVFSIDPKSGLIRLPTEYDPFSPYRTTWSIRMQKK